MSEDSFLGYMDDSLSLNLYTYCSNNPIIYFDPTGHWHKGDEKLNDDAKARVIALTNAYHTAATKAERAEIQKQADAIRTDNSSWVEKDTLIELDNVNAYNAYMAKAIKDGKLTDQEIAKSNSLINAVVSTSSQILLNSPSATATTTNTVMTMEKADITVQSTVTVSKQTNNVVAKVNMDVETHYEAYVFYMPNRVDAAKDEVKRIASFYGIDEGDIGTAVVATGDELTTEWGIMGDSDDIKIVAINSHADQNGLGFDDFGQYNLSTSAISRLKTKNIDTLFLSGCNAGHLNYKNTNPASQFAMIVEGGQVITSDGTDYNGPKWGFFGPWEYDSKNDTTFKDIRNKQNSRRKRDNYGWFIYQYTNGEITTSESLGKNLTLTQMLNKVK